ncbi:MAG: hypothetical protein Q9194_003749 [Teloschistes cf. exilis]
MRSSVLLTAGLSLVLVLGFSFDGIEASKGRSLIKRVSGKGSSSGPVDKPGSVPRPQAAQVKDPPPGRGGDGKSNKDVKDLEKIHEAPKYEKGYDFVRNGPPRRGDTGYFHNEKAKVIEIYYGDKTPRHAVNVEWNNLANGLKGNPPITMKAASSEQRQGQRKDSLRYLAKRGGTVLDEKPAASLSHDQWWTTIIRTPSEESKYEGQMYRQAHQIAEGREGYTLRYFDNRSAASKKDMDEQLQAGDLLLYRGPKVDGFPTPKHPTADHRSGVSDKGKIVDSKKATSGRKKNHKRDILDSMKAQEPAHQDPNAEYRQEINDYLDAFHSVQANATDVIWPFIEDMLAASNSSLVYEAAFAVFAHLTMAPVTISGPFAFGMHALDDYEDWLVASGASNKTITLVYAIDGILIDLYQTTWDNATTALSKTDLPQHLELLADFLDPDDRSMLPAGFTTVDPAVSDMYEVFLPPEDGIVDIASNGLMSTTGRQTFAPKATQTLSTTSLQEPTMTDQQIPSSSESQGHTSMKALLSASTKTKSPAFTAL